VIALALKRGSSARAATLRQLRMIAMEKNRFMSVFAFGNFKLWLKYNEYQDIGYYAIYREPTEVTMG
jgi:hypothetical protein